MDRSQVLTEVLSIPNRNILLELPTSFGKSKIAIELLKKNPNIHKVLIVIPRKVLIQNWIEEFNKWWPKYSIELHFSTYVSLPKHTGEWDAVVFDECHRLSERCRESLKDYTINNSILLSATVKDSLKDELEELFNSLYCYKISVKDAIENSILPDPRVLLLPLELDNTELSESFIIHPKAKGTPIETTIANLWRAKKDKSHKYIIRCTQQQRLNEYESLILWYKKQSYIGYMKNNWLHTCGERLKFLSDCKRSIILQILKKLSKYRTLTFCSSIEQTELFGKYCINSKNKLSGKILRDFNRGTINHITSCNMINEGINLINCKVGLYANLNSSEVLIKQRLGRLLRHPNPVIIIPYYKGTREEELVNKMLEDYNPALVTVINSIDDINI